MTALLLLAALAFDVLTPLGVAAGVAYLPAVLVAVSSGSRRAAVALAVTCTVLIVLVWALAPAHGIGWHVAVNRLIAIAAVWGTATFLVGRRAADERAQSAVDAAPIGMVTVDRSGLIVMVNAEAERMFGYRRDELLGRTIEVLVPQRVRDDHPHSRSSFVQSPTARAMGVGRELHAVCKDGHEIPVEIGLSPMELDGELFVQSAIVDITERRQAEEALAGQRARERAMLESSLDAVITIDVDGTVVEWNPAAERIFGYTRTYATGRKLASLVIPADQRERHAAGMRRYQERGESSVLGRRLELIAMRRDGEEFPVEIAVAKIEAAGHGLFTAYVRDITSRKRAEEATHRLAALVASSDDAIIGTTLDGHITSWNRGAEELYGYPADDVLGGASQGMLVPDDRLREIDTISERLIRGETVRQFETVRRRKDGSLIDVSVTVSLVRDGEGTVIGTSTITHDITARKRAEAALLAAHDDLEQRVRERTVNLEEANRKLEDEMRERRRIEDALRRSERLASVGTLAAGIAHEINNPLGLIRLEIDHLRETDETADALADSIETIDGEVLRCAHIVDGVLRFARAERSEKATHAVNAVVERASVLVGDLSREAGVRVELRLSEDTPAVVMNETDIEQVVANLVQNAIHACSHGGRVRIATERCGDGASIVVTDDGRGMSEREAARAFDPFFTTRVDSGGTGLGLSICHGIVTDHGGSLAIETEEGKGTTIRVELPAA